VIASPAGDSETSVYPAVAVEEARLDSEPD